MERESLETPQSTTILKNTLIFNKGVTTKTPTILIFHEWNGKDQFVEKIGERLLAMNYVCCLVDMYGMERTGSTKEECAALMMPLMENRQLIRQRTLQILDTVSNHPIVDPNRMAAIGFCFGGLCALDLARSGADLKGVISFHGLLIPPDLPSLIEAKVLVLHGNDDPMIKPQDILNFSQEMTHLNADFQIHTFGHTMHAFTNPKANDPSFGTLFSSIAKKRSFELMEWFFREVL